MSISFEGIGEVVATFLAQRDSTIKPGDVVCLTGNNQVGLGTEGAVPCGAAATVAEDGCIGVVVSGFTQVAYSGDSAPVAGWNTLAADGKGGMSVVSAGGSGYLVVSVDSASKTAVVKL